MPESASEIAHTTANIVTIFCVVWRMNNMNRDTPWLEISAWWALGVGEFWEVAVPHGIDGGHLMASIGIALIAVCATQPDWRPHIANRRRRPEASLPDDCDRRCLTHMGARKTSARQNSQKASA